MLITVCKTRGIWCHGRQRCLAEYEGGEKLRDSARAASESGEQHHTTEMCAWRGGDVLIEAELAEAVRGAFALAKDRGSGR